MRLRWHIIFVGLLAATAWTAASAQKTAVKTAAVEKAMDFQLSSPAFANQQPLPERYTCHGDGQSAPLRWQGAPSGTRSFALILHDPDASAPGGFTHWVVYDLPPALTEIPSGDYTAAAFPLGGLEGHNGRGEMGFTPSCPPPGAPHHYTFTLYALSVPSLGLPAGATRAQVLAALQGKSLAQAQLVGVYASPEPSPKP